MNETIPIASPSPEMIRKRTVAIRLRYKISHVTSNPDGDIVEMEIPCGDVPIVNPEVLRNVNLSDAESDRVEDVLFETFIRETCIVR